MKTPASFIYFLLILFSANATGRAQCVPASTAAGALDTCFGAGGKVTTDITADRDFARAIAVQPDGKIVVAGLAGYSAAANIADFAVVRYNTDGSLDTTFDGDGIAVTDFGIDTVDDDYVRGVAIQPDGKIIVAGRAKVGPQNYAVAVVRYNADGSLDTSFDADGKTQLELAAIVETYGVVLQPDGKIVVGGRFLSVNGFFGLVTRFNSNGSLDTSFGSNGFTTTLLDGVFAIALQPDGKIVAAGSLGVENPAFAVSRLHPDGSPDIFFGSNGVATHHPTLADQTWLVRIRFDNQIFVGGTSSQVQGNARGALLRFGTDGAFALGQYYAEENAFWSMTFQPDGKMLTVGQSILPFWGFTVKRHLDVNMADVTFNSNGAVYVKFLPAAVAETSGVNGIAMTPDNKIVVAGSVTEQDNTATGWRFAVTRLHSGLPAPHAERFDFDGDGKADVSVFRPSENRWYIVNSSNSRVTESFFGETGDRPVPADYDGDGKTDLAVFRNGDWLYLSSLSGTQVFRHWGSSGDIPSVSDFNGDGRLDFIVFRPSLNAWYRLSEASGEFNSSSFGLSGDKPLAGDFDGDGKSDKAIYRPSTGAWWWQSSIDNAQRAARWGISTDIPAAADYDGDGTTDFAVYRPSDGTWYIYNSGNNSSAAFNFGLAEDKPVPADYDGDGKADIAVFRPSNGTWYLLRSTAGFAALPFGISTDVPLPNAFVP